MSDAGGTSNPYAARQDLLQSPRTMATVVHAIVADKYGPNPEIYDWEPLTMCMELKADFQVDANPAVMDRWCAIQTLMSSDAFFTRIDAFLSICNTFSNGEPSFAAFSPVTLPEIAWGVAEAAMNRDMLPFSPTIRQYVGVVLKRNGYERGEFPPILDAVFDARPSVSDVKEGLVHESNSAVLQRYLYDNARDVQAQFDSLADLRNVDDQLLRRGLLRALDWNAAQGAK